MEARRAFGNRTLLEERSREVWQWPTLESMWADVRFALRQFRKAPGFAFAAIFTLMLAIGANAVVFGVLNALVLRPVHVDDAQSLYAINQANDHWISYPEYLDLRARNHTFSDIAALALSQVALDTGQDPSRMWGLEATGNYFDVLGIHPYLGRLFHPSDERG